MKWELWLIVIAVLVVLTFSGIFGMNNTIQEQQGELEERDGEISRLEAEISSLQEQLRAPPYVQPLDRVRISSGCGYRMDPMGGGTEGLHKGVDLVGPIGTPIKAIRDGVVVEHWPAPGTKRADGVIYRGHDIFGGYVVIDHGDGLFSLYGHMSSTCVHQGWRVEAGDKIGELGDTGIATGLHLHFEIVVDGLKYLAGEL